MQILIAGMLLAAIGPVSSENPNRQPQMAVSGNRVALVFGSGKSLLFARSDDGGKTFTEPSKIAEMPVVALGRHRGPRVAFAGEAIVVSAIGGSQTPTGPHAHGLPPDGNLLAWRSTDGGKSWSQPTVVNDSPASAREGLHAMAGDVQGNIAAVWLDLRSKGTRLYGALSRDGGATWTRNFPVYESPDGTICECCHPSLLAMGGGEFAVMFRNVVAGSRDLYVLRIRDGKVTAPAERSGTGTWQLNACPMDGGGIAASNGKVLAAWRRDKEVFLASPGKPETRLGEGKDVALAAGGSKTFVVWNEGGAIRAWVSGKPETLSPEGAFPSVTALADGGALAAWEEKGSIALRRLE